MRSLKSILPTSGKRNAELPLPTQNDSSIDLDSLHTAEAGPSRLPGSDSMDSVKEGEGKDGYASSIPTLKFGHGPSHSHSLTISDSDTNSNRNPFSSTRNRSSETLPTFTEANAPPLPAAGEAEAEEGEVAGKIKGPNIMDMVKQDYRVLKDLLKRMTWRDWVKIFCRKHLIKWYILLVIVIVVTVLLSSNHKTIANFIKPVGEKIRSWPGGWLIPIVILIILSFPPLVGHEVVGIVIGMLWGLNIGFWILAAGTFLGELATWFVFRSLCTKRADKFEKKNKYYSSLTQLIREKSFWFVLVLRFSAIPGHVTTALSSSAGANFWSYCAAAILTLPKQLSLVYVGTAINSDNSTTHAVSVFTLILTIVGTGIAAVYIYYQMRMYLIRKETEKAALAAAEAGDTEMAMAEGGTSATLDTLGGGFRPRYQLNEEEGEETSPAQAYKQAHQQKHVRRPFIHSNSSFSLASGARTPIRSKSLGVGDAEMIEYYLAKRKAKDREAVPDVMVQRPSGVGERADYTYDSERTSAEELPTHLGVPAFGSGRPRSDTATSTASMASERLLLEMEEIKDATDVVRGTASLDLWRPAHMDLHPERRDAESRRMERDEQERAEREAPVSGRELAKDADEYAIKHGARRPDYGRHRGESSAALLGRPEIK